MEKLTIEPFVVWCTNRDETNKLKSEVFTHHTYYFETENPKPLIIDAGAHIGLATLYFKKVYPDAHIVAIEPHPDTFALLQKNCQENNLDNVQLINAALGAKDGITRSLYADTEFDWHSTASFLPGAWNGAQKTKAVPVQSITLSSLLTQRVDLLKLDIESAETEVLQSSAVTLKNVAHIICEFHPTTNQKREQFISFLEQHNYSVTHENKTQRFHGPRELEIIEAIQVEK